MCSWVGHFFICSVDATFRLLTLPMSVTSCEEDGTGRDVFYFWFEWRRLREPIAGRRRLFWTPASQSREIVVFFRDRLCFTIGSDGDECSSDHALPRLQAASAWFDVVSWPVKWPQICVNRPVPFLWRMTKCCYTRTTKGLFTSGKWSKNRS